MSHRWLLQLIVANTNVLIVKPPIFRYNANNATKAVLAHQHHHIELELLNKLNKHSTVLLIGPYICMNEADYDINYLKSSHKKCDKKD